MKEIILCLIEAMEAEKVKNKVDPSHVTGKEINTAIKVSLRELVDEGSIEAGKTINDYYVKTKS